MTFPSRFVLAAIAVVGCLVIASCGDDPVTPGGTYIPPSYHPEILSLDADFSSVCGAGTRDLYAVGSVILHHDGNAWDVIEPPAQARERLRLGFAFATGELVISDGFRVYLRQGESWTLHSEVEGLGELWGPSPNDLYARTWNGVFHFDGSSWSPAPIEKNWEIQDITGDEQGHLLMCGSSGRLDRVVDGQLASTWLDSTLYFNTVTATPSGRVYVATSNQVFEVTGSTLVGIGDLETQFLRSDGEQLFVVGGGSHGYGVSQYDGGSWHDVGRLSTYLNDFWAGHGDLVAAGNRGFLWQGNASGGNRVPLYPTRGPTFSMVAIDDAIYTMGFSSYRYEDGLWTNLNKEYVTGAPANDIDGRKRTDIYAVGDDMILHYDGAEWSWVNSGLSTGLTAVWVEPNGDVVAVGRGPTIVEYENRQWTKTQIPINVWTFNDIVGVNGLIVAVGDNRLTAVRRHGEWYITPAPTKGHLTAVWAFDDTHIYASNYRSNEIAFFDGKNWSAIELDENLDRTVSIWGTSPNNIFLLDYYGNLTRFEGRNYVPEERVMIDRMFAMCGTNREVLIAGNSGIVSYRR